jgi:hypothetical protein
MLSTCSITNCVTTILLMPMVLLMTSSAQAADPPVADTYADDFAFLASHTNVLELVNEHGGRIIICPDYQGRVMTSSCNGQQGRSFGWINRDFIDAGEPSDVFNNYGGEDRFWLAPEGGPFSLWFAKGETQDFDNWHTPPAMNDGAFRVTSGSRDPFYRMTRTMRLTNASGTELTLDIERTVRLAAHKDITAWFGDQAAAIIDENADVKMIGFTTENKATNRGAAHHEETGLVSIWSLGMFRPGDDTYVVIPYRPGDEAELGTVVISDYFGEIPADRLKVLPKAIVFRADGKYRGKLGVTPKRVLPVAGSIDFANSVLTLVHFTLPEKPAEATYLDSRWLMPHPSPLEGDAFNSYNDGPPEPGAESLGGFYELESLSPTRPLATGESLRHAHSTFHIAGPLDKLTELARLTLGVELDDVRAAMDK